MTQRCTFALDEVTTTRIRRLATLWEVSQAEVIRRAVATAETPVPKPDPVEVFRQLHQSDGGLSRPVAQAYLSEVRAARRKWRGK